MEFLYRRTLARPASISIGSGPRYYLTRSRWSSHWSMIIATRCHRTRSSLASPTARQRNSSPRSSLNRGSHSTNRRGEQRFIFWLNQESPHNSRTDLPIIYEQWSSKLVNTINRLLRTLVRNTYMHHLNEIFYTVENEYSPVGAAATPQAVRDKVFSVLSKFFSPLSRFPRRWETSCTCRLRWRLPLGATSLATWFTSTSIPPWSHDYSD